jgi:hypothetical protein
MRDRSGLERTQQLFWELIAAPEGAASGVAALSEGDRDEALAMVRRRAGMTQVERLDVYANMYFFRILDVLKEDYPVLLALLGDDAFHNLVTDYLLKHPSRHWSLRWAGERLPEFLRSHAAGHDAPHLADVAALEWALHDAFDSADATPLRAVDLAVLAPEAWPELVLVPDPSLRLLDLATPASRLWQDVKAGRGVTPPPPGRHPVRVWRRQLRVFHKDIEPFEHEALTLVAEGLPFAEVCARLAGSDGDPSQAAHAVVELLRAWLADEIVCQPGER